MAEKITSVQPAVLRWARESQGYTVDDVAHYLKRESAEVAAWENGKALPTYSQLETLAYKLYKRPLAIFFFPKPPVEPSLKKEFRTLPDSEMESLEPNTRYLLRYAKSLQLSLAELNDGINPATQQIFRDITLSTTQEIPEQAEKVRKYLGISLETQKTWQKDEVALKNWRLIIEKFGVFVFKDSFKQKTISGFCLLDQEFPIIFLNNSTTKTRQIFSLFHELTHLLLHMNGISKFDSSYIKQLQPNEKRIEQFCNAFTAELLIPTTDFEEQLGYLDHQNRSAWIENTAKRYSVSREVILRKILDKGLVTQAFYEEKAAEWAGQMKKKQGGSYYPTQAAYLGESYLHLVFGKYYQGKLNLDQVAQFLGVKTKNIAGLEELTLRKAVAE